MSTSIVLTAQKIELLPREIVSREIVSREIVPCEVEEVLYMHDKVMEATVAGIPDPKRGESVKAFMVLKQGQRAEREETRAVCKQQLAPCKVPTFVALRTDLPKSQTGKILRRVLVEADKQKMAKGD